MAQMGMGLLGDPNIIFKRKFRWTFSVRDICGGNRIPPNFVKLAARPNLDIEETEINYLNSKTWIPGKGSWNSIQVTYYDISVPTGGGTTGAVTAATSTDGDPTVIFTWLQSVYDFGDPVQLNNGARRSAYAGTANLILYDGCGNPLEQWTLGDMWPQAVDFGDLDYSSSDTVDIQLTLRYSQVTYRNICGRQPQKPCCFPCG